MRITSCARSLGTLGVFLQEGLSQSIAMYRVVASAINGRRRVTVRRAVVVCGSLLLTAASTRAAVIMSDSFEYTNQAAYDAAWPAVSGISPNATLDSTRASDGVKSVTTPSTASNSQYESIRSFTELGNPSASNFITFSFDFYDSSASAAPYRDFATIHDAAGSSAGQLVSMGLNNSLTSANDNGNFYIARILGFTPTYEGTGNPAATSGSYFKLNDGGSGTLRSTGWHNLKVVIDNSNFKFYVDNILSKTIANGVTLRSYDNVTIGSGLSSATAAGFDNMLVGAGAVPEPASLGILGCAAAGLLRRRKI